MARTLLTSQTPTVAGAAITPEAANVDGNAVDLTGDKLLYVNNGSGSSINVTIESTRTEDGLAMPNRVVAVAAGAWRLIRLTRVSRRRDNGQVYVNYSAVTTVSVAAISA